MADQREEIEDIIRSIEASQDTLDDMELIIEKQLGTIRLALQDIRSETEAFKDRIFDEEIQEKIK